MYSKKQFMSVFKLLTFSVGIYFLILIFYILTVWENKYVLNNGFHLKYSQNIRGKESCMITDTTPSNSNISDDKFINSVITNDNVNYRARILLYGSYHAGSSYLGHLFYSNPEVFYLFEPLGLYEDTLMSLQDYRIQPCGGKPMHRCMEKVFNCDIEGLLSEDMHKTPNKGNWSHIVLARVAQENNIKSNEINFYKWNSLCKNETRYKHIATKIIRSNHIEEAIPLMKSGVKVIYQMRDPRSQAVSQTFVVARSNLMTSMRKECKKQLHNIEFLHYVKHYASLDMKELFEKQLVVLRYEDLSLNLLQYGKAIYDFVGISSIPESVNNFLKSNPKVIGFFENKTNVNQTKETKSISQENILKNLEKWRFIKSQYILKDIEQECKEAMDLLGYLALGNKTYSRFPSIQQDVSELIPFYLKINSNIFQ